MNFLLDSDVVIDFLRSREPGFSLFKKTINNKLNISVISWAEIVYGIKKSENPQRRMHQFNNFLSSLAVVTIPVDEKVAINYIDLKITVERKRTPFSDFDLLIAATALSKNLTLVTRNQKHFSRIPNLKVL